MTKEQVEKFNLYFKEKNPTLFDRLEGIAIFIKANPSDQLSLMFWEANNKPRATEDEKKQFFGIVASFKKENKIYNPVPNIEDDFFDFILKNNLRLYESLAEITITNVDGKLEPKFVTKYKTLSIKEYEDFHELWFRFLDGLKFIGDDPL